jgi:hypothetical protein
MVNVQNKKIFSEIIELVHSKFQELINESKNDEAKIIGLMYALSFLIDVRKFKFFIKTHRLNILIQRNSSIFQII